LYTIYITKTKNVGYESKRTFLCAFFIVGKQEYERVGEVPLMEKWKEEARARGMKMEKMI